MMCLESENAKRLGPMTLCRRPGMFSSRALDPGIGRCHHREADVIDHGKDITVLDFAAATVSIIPRGWHAIGRHY
jgi:hypothetical protein